MDIPENTQDIDWDAIWRELDWDAVRGREESAQRRLEQRARQYASLLPDEEVATDVYHMLAFRLGDEHYAIDVIRVQAVRPLDQVTPVPATPSFYKGVVNVRGQIISVIDLRIFFDMNVQDTPQELIIVRVNQLEIGLLADQVLDVETIPATSIEPVEDMKYAIGMTHERMTLLDVAALFDDERLVVGGVDE